MAEVKGQPRPSGKVKAVKQFGVRKVVERRFGGGGDHLAVPSPNFMIGHGSFLSLKEDRLAAQVERRNIVEWNLV